MKDARIKVHAKLVALLLAKGEESHFVVTKGAAEMEVVGVEWDAERSIIYLLVKVPDDTPLLPDGSVDIEIEGRMEAKGER